MQYDVVIHGWVRIEAESEEEADAKGKEITVGLLNDALRGGLGQAEGTAFQMVGLHPLADPPADEAK